MVAIADNDPLIGIDTNRQIGLNDRYALVE